MAQILCSTGALLGMPNGRNFRLLEEFSKQLHCDGFEFMMYSTWYDRVDELLAFLKSLNLNIPVLHCEKKIGESISQGEENLADAFRRFEINCRIAKELGASKMVIHLWDGLTSDSNFQNNINAYPKFAAMAESYGISLMVENVVCNHKDPMCHWLELAELYPQIKFIFDTKMAAFHSQLDLIYQPEYAFLHRKNHIQHYHLNDYAGGYMEWAKLRTLPIGKGNIDFQRFFRHIKAIGYNDTFTVEATAFNSEGVVDIEMLNGQFQYIRSALNL